ncbi:kinase-like protein [Xylariaceae sp. FL1272]|nr:kinase-like protein [Xylariaceae sp. FL1272]
MSRREQRRNRDDDYTSDGDVIYQEVRAPGLVENIQEYNKGGHHPVHLGDVLGGRYEVAHKLGHGGVGIVWLCFDKVASTWRAVKIMTASASSEPHELEIYKHLRETATHDQMEANHVVTPYHEFWIRGPNGNHLCIVLPVLGGDVASWLAWIFDELSEETLTQRLAATKWICSHITRSVRFLHNRGICHGDLKPENILMRVQDISKLNKREIWGLLGAPVCDEVVRKSGRPGGSHAPRHVVRAPKSFWWASLLTNEVALIDFGASFFASDTTHDPSIVTTTFAPPEFHFDCGGPVGTHSDIWSLALTLYEISTGNEGLFPSLKGNPKRLEIVPRDLETFLGPLPEPFRSKYLYVLELNGNRREDLRDRRTGALQAVSYSPERFRQRTEEVIGSSRYSTTLEAAIGRRHKRSIQGKEILYRFPRKDVIEFAAFLRTMLVYDPKKRASANGVLHHPWLDGQPRLISDESNRDPPTIAQRVRGWLKMGQGRR